MGFSLSVLVQAIETANSTEPEAVAEVLRDIHVDTLFGEVAFDENSRQSFPLQTGWKENATQTRCHSMERAARVCLFAVASGTFLNCALPDLLLPTLHSHGRLDAQTDETYTFDVDFQRLASRISLTGSWISLLGYSRALWIRTVKS